MVAHRLTDRVLAGVEAGVLVLATQMEQAAHPYPSRLHQARIWAAGVVQAGLLAEQD